MINISKEDRNVFNFDRLVDRKLEAGMLSGKVLEAAHQISKDAYFKGKVPFYYKEMSKTSYEEVQTFVLDLMRIINNGYSKKQGTLLTKKATQIAMDYGVNTR